MSVLQGVAPKLQEAIEELQKIQYARRKARMALELGDGYARFIDSADNIVGENSGQIILQNCNGNLELSVGVGRFPCNKIIWYHCIDTIITFDLEGFFAAKKDRVIAHIKPPAKPRPLTYQHDGNITSSGSESEDSARDRTTGSVDNSFESDNPSIPENL